MTPVKDAYGHVLGYLDNSSSMAQTVKSINNIILGYYYPSSNKTIRANGIPLGPGDLRLMLLKA